MAPAASNDLSVLDVSDPVRVRRTAHVSVEDNSRGIAATSDGRWVFVNNTLAGTVSFIDAASYTVVDSVPATENPLPPVLLNGKRLFHSSARPEVSQAAWVSCNTCHIEGEYDGRTWVLQYTGAVPPGAKPATRRNTTIFDSPRTQCAECHRAPVCTDLKVHDAGSADGEGEWFGPKIDTPTLRYRKGGAPYMHDGGAPGLREVLTSANRNDRHGVTSHLLPQEIEDLIAFLLILPYE
ncbi:MAG: hypothetical protein Q8N47_07650 [Bryobacterales bacterium]|nr:hypothetical protein [Bryobacterales bacterium]